MSKVRHPEKVSRGSSLSPAPLMRKPPWLRVRAPSGEGFQKTNAILKIHRLPTVCQEASCPNVGECWNMGHATFMIMGSICTRACAFCDVITGLPKPLDPTEPERISSAIEALKLNHVVITSVDRDDLPDGGGEHFGKVVAAIRERLPSVSIEILTPDFLRKPHALKTLFDGGKGLPDVFNHNVETVPRLYAKIRPGARYFHSLQLLARAKEEHPLLFTKSGMMVGLGEALEEVLQVMDDLRSADVDFLTIGQYLQPSRKHASVVEYVLPETFERLGKYARSKGFSMVSSTPLTRSSYHAGDDFRRLKKARKTLEKNKSHAVSF